MENLIVDVTSAPHLVVLDSNIWVDLLIFADPHVISIKQALEEKTIEAIVCPICREELARVLTYSQFAHKQIDTEQALAWFDQHTTPLAAWIARQPNPASAAQPIANLPRCTDPDDQKFLEVAAQCRARWLISKDRAVLKTRRLMKNRAHVEVISLLQWNKEHVLS
jgi:uncharacterized protein